MNTAFVSFAVFVLLLAALVALRVRSGNTIDIRSSDIVLALLPVAFWLLLTGQVQEFGFGELKITAAIKKAAKEPVNKQVVAALPIEALRTSPKGGQPEIQKAINDKSQAISFRLGTGGYYTAAAITEYLDRLIQYPYLRYLVLNKEDGKFFGLVDARQLASVLRSTQRPAEPPPPPPAPAEPFSPTEQRSISIAEPRLSAKKLADWLNQGNEAELATLPGFIAATLSKNADRKEALQAMNSLDVPTIPVVDENGKFVGTIDRSKLTASILTDIAAKVDKDD